MGRKAKQRRKKQKEKKEEAAASETLKYKGNRFFIAQDYKKALQHYSDALKEEKKDHTIYSNRAATYIHLKQFDKALQDADKTISLKPSWPKGYYRRGVALENLYRYLDAHQTYSDALKKFPKDPLLTPQMEKLSKLLSELKITEKQLSSAKNPESDRFTSMCNWMRKGGAKFPMLYLQYYSEDYRGVHSLCHVSNNAQILYVPLTHIMTSEVAKASDVGKKILASGLELRSKHSWLASYVLQEKHKKKQSYWYPYIRILPEHYRNMPIFFNDKQLAWLKGSFSLDMIANRIESLKREYDNICRNVPDFKRFTHREFVWARLVVITRIFGLVINGKKTDGLVPYADMLNHKRPRETKWTYDDDQTGFTITTLRAVQRGEQMYDSYGRKCNSRFFVNYGFSIDDNSEDNEAVIPITLTKDYPHYFTKMRILGSRHGAHKEFQIPANYAEKKTKELFSFVRFVHARDNEVLLCKQLDEVDPLSVANESRVLLHLKVAAQSVLKGFETTIEEDEKLLKSKPQSEWDSNLRNCVVMRMGEKKVLRWFVELADKCVPMLSLPWKDLKRQAAKQHQAGTTPLDTYVTGVVVPLVKKAS